MLIIKLQLGIWLGSLYIQNNKISACFDLSFIDIIGRGLGVFGSSSGMCLKKNSIHFSLPLIKLAHLLDYIFLECSSHQGGMWNDAAAKVSTEVCIDNEL